MPRCHAKAHRTGEQCRRAAMHGKTVCSTHGGLAGRPIIHGRYSKSLEKHPDVLAYYEIAKTDPQLGETLNEIAFLRAKLQHWLESFGGGKDQFSMQVIREYAESITHLVERRHKMLYGEQVTLTTKQFDVLATRVLEVVREIYGEDDRYNRFLLECRKLQVAASNRASGTAD
ncbi:MAG: hypothetical protein Q7O66_16755 [Dehalococcoidia bacterium]|nr:hypothetical protein [Dehalococcoidia bacterium]